MEIPTLEFNVPDHLPPAQQLNEYRKIIQALLYHDHRHLRYYLDKAIELLPYSSNLEQHASFFHQTNLQTICYELDFTRLYDGIRAMMETLAHHYKSNQKFYFASMGYLAYYLGDAFHSDHYYQKALHCFTRALDETEKSKKALNAASNTFDYSMAWLESQVARCYTILQQYDKAEDHYQAALFWIRKGKFTTELQTHHICLAIHEERRKRYKFMAHYLQLAEQATMPTPYIVGAMAEKWGEYYLLGLNDVQQAIPYFKKSYEYAKHFNNYNAIRAALAYLIQCAQQLQDINMVNTYMAEYIQISDFCIKAHQQGSAQLLELLSAQYWLDSDDEAQRPYNLAHFLSDALQKSTTQENEGYQILKCIFDHLACPSFDIQKLSQLLNVSERNLYRRVSHLYDMPPKKLIQTIRLQTAKTLLEHGKAQASDVHLHVGYSSQSYFSQSFKLAFGISPTQIKPI